MTRTRLLILTCFAAAFAAGISGGLVIGRQPRKPPPPPFLVQQLDLTPEQAERVRDIWSKTYDSLRATLSAKREALEQDREDAILAILTEDQLAFYQQVTAGYRAERDRLAEERKAAIEQAVERTKAVLTDEQKAKYEALLAEREKQGGSRWGRGHRFGPRDPRPGTQRGEDRASTAKGGER